MSFVLPEPRRRSNVHLRDRVTLVRGDITRQADIDAILSTLPLSLTPGGALNDALFAAAGPRLDEMVLEEIFKPKLGDAYIFPACNLPVKQVIFVITEDWDAGIGVQDRDLLRVYRRGMEAAQHKAIRRIAVPALKLGEENFPVKRTARLAVQGIMDRLTDRVDEVRIVCGCDETHAAFHARLSGG